MDSFQRKPSNFTNNGSLSQAREYNFSTLPEEDDDYIDMGKFMGRGVRG